MNIKIIKADEFDSFKKKQGSAERDESDEAKVNAAVCEIIAAVRKEGDAAVRRYSLKFEKAVPDEFEIDPALAKDAWGNLKNNEPRLAASLSLAADHLKRFAELQKDQFRDFETEMAPGLFTGQKVIPVERAGIYVPGGRFPLISSALMTLVPAKAAGVKERIFSSPPGQDGIPDQRILAAAYLAGADRYFALGGAQAIAALALGTETIPRVDLIAGPGNKYVAAAKRLLFGEVGIDFIAGPTDVLIIVDGETARKNTSAATLVAADMLAQAEHDPDARARALVPDRMTADLIAGILEKRLVRLPAASVAAASLEAGGLIIVYESKDEAIEIANRIAPEHLELFVSAPDDWIPSLHNFGSLFINPSSAEVLGDYSAGINHTLPTSASARFTGGLSVRHFLKSVTTLRCVPGRGYVQALEAAETIAHAEGLEGHAESAILRLE